MDTASLIFFSPTRTTLKTVEAVCEGLGAERRQRIDLTRRVAGPEAILGELAVIGVPVYSGRLPRAAVERLENLRGEGRPAILVVVYGNRAYDDALLELEDLCVRKGFVVVSAGAFIGEHSYSTKTFPIAEGRPDREDLEEAKRFGAKSLAKWADGKWIPIATTVPGKQPYKESRSLHGVKPAFDAALCSACLSCVAVCPTEAIGPDDPGEVDGDKCIRCAACIKICPAQVKRFEDQRILEVSAFLHEHCSSRKAPECFF
ncbi:MAG TPA: 4Fe-4S binding protein [Rectinemataceae bacterium]|nr:4Fe-4S binding protein [Rectinemataceae bacterium]